MPGPIVTGTAAGGQACFGRPVAAGESAIGAGMLRTHRSAGYQVMASTALAHPVAVQAWLGRVASESHARDLTTTGGVVGITLRPWGVCPYAGLGFSAVRDEVDGSDATISRLSIPIGVAIGEQYDLGRGIRAVPSVRLSVVGTRDSFRFRDGRERVPDGETWTALQMMVGGAAAAGPIFVEGSVTIIAGTDAVLAVGAGVIF